MQCTSIIHLNFKTLKEKDQSLISHLEAVNWDSKLPINTENLTLVCLQEKPWHITDEQISNVLEIVF